MNKHQITFTAQVISAPVSILIFFILLMPEYSKTVADIEFMWPLIWAVVSGVATNIFVTAILAARFKLRSSLKLTDERDIKIHRLGEFYTQGFYIIGGVLALVLSIIQADYFWIGLSVFLSFALASAVASFAKLIMYRFGISE